MFRSRLCKCGFRKAVAVPSELAAYAERLKGSLSLGDRQSLQLVAEDLVGKGLIVNADLKISKLVELAFSFDTDLPQKLQCLKAFEKVGIKATPQAYHDLVVATESALGVLEAEKVALEMIEAGVHPLRETWHLLIAKQTSDVDRQRILRAMIASGTRPDKQIFAHLLKGDQSFEVALQEVRNAGGAVNLYTCNALLDALAEKPDLGAAEGLLAFMKEIGLRPSPYSFHSIITARASSGPPESALNVLGQMENEGVKPIVGTYNCLAKGYALAGDFQDAREIVNKMDDVEGFYPNSETFNGILEGHRQHMDAAEMRTTLQMMGSRAVDANLQTFDAVETVLCLDGRDKAADADRVLKEMETSNIPISRDVWHHCLLQGFEDAGAELKDLLLNMYKRMQVAAGDRPNRITYNILVEWLAKKGLEEEAEATVRDMLDLARIRPSPYTFRILDSLPGLKQRIEDEVASRILEKEAKEQEEWQRKAWRVQRLAS